jgi:hypothetical protein
VGFLKKKSKEWKGLHFVIISLLVTTASITFFFAARHFLINIKQGQYSASPLTQWFSELGGVQVKAINLKVNTPDSLHTMNYLEQVQEKLEPFKGHSFWLLDLDEIKSEVLKHGWVQDVAVQREFPDSLNIEIDPRVPAFVIRSKRGWLLLDKEGHALTITDQVSGAWANLPIVYGLEEAFSLGHSVSEINRTTTLEQKALRDLVALLEQLDNKVGITVESVNVRKDDWVQEFLFELSWKTENKNSMDYSLVFQSENWKSRIESLQFVLSDLRKKDVKQARILGQYSGRWFVERGEN